MELNLNKLHDLAIETKLPIESLVILLFVYQKLNIDTYLSINKLSFTKVQTLLRKQLLKTVGPTYKLTDIGLKTINSLLAPQKVKTPDTGQFEELWALYPASDKFEGFPKTRTLRSKKDYCKAHYLKILETITHANVMKALEYEVQELKDISLREGKNKFSFMMALPTWLNSKQFEVTLENLEESSDEYDLWTDRIN